MKRSLKSVVVNQIGNKSLDKDQLAQLHTLLENSADSKPSGRSGRRIPAWLPASSMVVVGLIAGLMFFVHDDRSPSLYPVSPQIIAEEVVANHMKQRPLEIKGGKLADLGKYFYQLEFRLVNSDRIGNRGQLLGGRYCSLQGHPAAQLRLKNRISGKSETLYQTVYLPKVFGDLPDRSRGEAPVVAFARGVKVRIWIEKGILFALTED